MKFKRRIFPKQWPGQGGQAEGIGVLRHRPGQGKDAQNEKETERGAGEAAGSHDGIFKLGI